MVWTDDRMDDLARRMDAGFARTDHEIATLRAEMREGFRDIRVEFKGDIESLRTELKGDIHSLRTEIKSDIEALRSLTMRLGVGIIIVLIGVLATSMGG